LIELDLFFEDGTRRHGRFEIPLVMGRAPDCGIQVSHWRVARQHLRISRAEDGYHVDDLGSILGTRVNGNRITRYGPLKKSDEIVVGPCLLRLASQAAHAAAIKSVCSEGSPAELGRLQLQSEPRSVDNPKLRVHSEARAVGLDRSQLPSEPRSIAVGKLQLQSEQNLLAAEPSSFVFEKGVFALTARTTAADTKEVPLGAQRLLDEFKLPEPNASLSLESVDLAQQELRQELRAGLIQAFDLRRNDVGALSEGALKAHALTCVGELLDKRRLPLSEVQRSKILKLVVDEAIGLGVIEELLEDTSVTEIMVNRFDEIYVEAGGRISKQLLQFSSEQAVRSVIERIVFPLGRRIDEASPMVDARLPNGSRLNAVLPPLSVKGASFTIRKFPQKRLPMQD